MFQQRQWFVNREAGRAEDKLWAQSLPALQAQGLGWQALRTVNYT